MRWNLKGRHHMGMQPVLVMLRMVLPLHEHLAFKRIPVAVQQRAPQSVGLLLQLDNVVLGQMRVVRR